MTQEQKQQFADWLTNNLQLTSKSNVELIVRHVENYFCPPAQPAKPDEGSGPVWVNLTNRKPDKSINRKILIEYIDTGERFLFDWDISFSVQIDFDGYHYKQELVRWLDETASATTDNGKEAKEFGEWLRINNWEPATEGYWYNDDAANEPDPDLPDQGYKTTDELYKEFKTKP